MSKNEHDPAAALTLAALTAGPGDALPAAMPARDADEADDWLGCEGLHPLTWLPGPAGAATAAVAG